MKGQTTPATNDLDFVVERGPGEPSLKIDKSSGVVLVTQAADREEVLGGRGVLLDLGAEALDVDVQCFGVAYVVGSPDAVDQLAAGQHPAYVAQKVLEQVEFLQR